MTHTNYMSALYIVMVTLCICMIASFTHAQESTSSTPENISESIPSQDTPVAQKAEPTLPAQAQDRFINLTLNVMNRMDAVINRFDNILGRLDSRVAKMKAEGFNTAVAEEEMASARGNLLNAKMMLTELPSLNQELRSDTPRESFILIRTQLWSIKDALKRTHTDLRDAVKTLKEAQKNLGEAPKPETIEVTDVNQQQ